ncbi:hypothetical protein D3C71_2199100 [compost metagenome]
MAGPTATVVNVYAVSMVRVSDLKNSSARFSMTMEMPSVTSRMFSSLPWLARLMTRRCSA